MRALRILALLLIAVLLADEPIANAATVSQKATVVHPRWHRVAGNVETVVAGGKYLALTNNEGTISLLNKQTRERQALLPANCPGVRAVGFGGRWFAVSCGATNGTNAIVVDLYGLSTETWTQQAVAPTICGGTTGCIINDVGTTWIRFFEVTPSGCSAHCGYEGYLQNISTGAVEEDPVDSSTAPQDDLNTPSGAGTPCITLPSGAYSQTYGPPLLLNGNVSFWQPVGQFVLITGFSGDEGAGTPDYLYGCGAMTKLRLPRTAFASADAVVYQRIEGSAAPLIGRYLPTLRSFTVPKPKGGLVALSNTTLYTRFGAALWAGTFKQPRPRVHPTR